jgi:PKD domain-containing protein
VPRVVLLALALILIAAAAASAASVTIAPSGGGASRTLGLGGLSGSYDVHGATYTVRAADGGESAVSVADGISLNALLAAAGLDGDAFDYIALGKADGSSAIVMRDDLGGTEEGPPVVWSDDQGVHFLRPAGRDGDANGVDLVTLADGAPLAIALKTGSPLVPRIAVSTLRARVGARVDFSASLVGGAPLGPGLDYSWYFGDGSGYISGANRSHRYRRPGRYLVLLNVARAAGDTIGAPDTVTVSVVRSRKRHPGEARPAGDAGTGAPGPGAGSSTGAGGGAGAGAVPAAPPVTVPAPTAAVSPSSPAPRQMPHTPRTPPGRLVSGTLIAAASVADSVPEGAPAADAAVRRATTDRPLHVPVGVWAGLGLALLLALGWALESRHTLPFWQP